MNILENKFIRIIFGSLIIIFSLGKIILSREILSNFSFGGALLLTSIFCGAIIIFNRKELFEYISAFFRWSVAGFFIFAAVGKIANPAQFAKEIANYQMLPNFAINTFALILPWIEISSGIFFISGVKIKSSGALIGGMLIMFIIAISTAYARGLNINCGCASQLGAELVGWGKLFEDFIMLLGVIFSLVIKDDILVFKIDEPKEIAE